MEDIMPFFQPDSIVLVGATDRQNSVGRIMLGNLLLAKDSRRIYLVNPRKETVMGIKCYPKVSSLPEVPDLAVIAIDARMVPDIVEESGKAGIRAMIIISAGFKETGQAGKERGEQILATARKYNIRIIGPNCLGVIRPSAKLNATFANKMTKPGSVAFLSQSGALDSAVLDWAISRDIGFSTFVSLGSMLDIDFGELVDYLGEDPETRSIIIYLESLGGNLLNARKFMSAARGFARNKPIIVIKPGKYQESRNAVRSHTGAMVGEDIYYDAAFDRAGVVRVAEIQDLFNCAAILNTAKLPKAPNLAIITNAGGPAVLATDALIDLGGQLARLSDETVSRLNDFLPPFWSQSNPVDILGDADPQRYLKTIETIGKDSHVNGILVIYTPQGPANPKVLAQAIIQNAASGTKPILTAIMGSEALEDARQLLYDSNIPTYGFPEEAIKTYMYMYQYSRNLEELYETPADSPLNLGVPKNYIKVLVKKAINEARTVLSEEDSKKILITYGIQAAMPHFAKTAEDAASLAASVGYPVVMKIASPDILHKSDIGGVILNLGSERDVKKAFEEIMQNVKHRLPDARIEGVSIQKMVTDCDYELIIGSRKDAILGPVIMFGLGGTETEILKDVAVGLPPLNQKLTRRILERTRIYKALSQSFRSKPPINLSLLDETIVKVSNLIVDFPEIKELDINPLSVCGESAIALDAKVILDESVPTLVIEDYSHLIISPYPTKYIQPWQCRDGRNVVLRPIRPEDEPLERELLAGLSPESSRFRFFQIIKEISHEMLSRFCNIDYDREMAIIAEYTEGKKRRNVGVGRLFVQRGQIGEFAVLVADDFQNNGLGLKLCDVLIGIAREKGLSSIYGIVSNNNRKMLNLVRVLGFISEPFSRGESKVVLSL
jgi:acetyltransferase